MKLRNASSFTARPLADATQMKTVQSYLESGKEGGAQVLLGGEKLDKEGHYVPPTIFTGVKDDAKINKEEIFGPVAILHTFTDDGEAIRRANDTEYGLFGEWGAPGGCETFDH